VQISSSMPSPLPAERIPLKARARPLPGRLFAAGRSACATTEQYFVPQGEGRRLEGLGREKKLAARIAVDSGGNAALKGLVIDGKLEYQELLF
jgi:GDYXXLXY protein